MEKIDLNTWKRKDIFKMFSSYSNPYYNVGFNLDITDLKNYAEKRKLSFYKTMIYCISTAVNKTEAFLYFYKDGNIFKSDGRQPSYTYLPKGSDTLRFIYAETDRGLDHFMAMAEDAEKNQEILIETDKESDELIHITSLPWLDLTSFTNARDLTNRYESVPKFAWGKFMEKDGRYILNMSLEVNHCFIDGISIRDLTDNFYTVIKELGE